MKQTAGEKHKTLILRGSDAPQTRAETTRIWSKASTHPLAHTFQVLLSLTFCKWIQNHSSMSA